MTRLWMSPAWRLRWAWSCVVSWIHKDRTTVAVTRTPVSCVTTVSLWQDGRLVHSWTYVESFGTTNG